MIIIYCLLGVLLIANLFTNIALFDLKKEYKDSREVNKLITELWKNNNSQMDRMYKVHIDIYNQYQDILESYRLMNSIYEKIKEQYQDILSNNAELLVYGESIENRYSDCYEQFNNLNDKINEVLTVINNKNTE